MRGFTGAKGKIVRRFGVNIYGNVKFDQLLANRPQAPGQHGASRRRKESEFGKQLVEKQKLKLCYGMSEKQFRRYFQKAKSQKGMTGENLLVMLERRLDNVVYRAGLAGTRSQARQLISHYHLRINGRKVNIPSILVKEGDVITVREKSGSQNLVKKFIQDNSWKTPPEWVQRSDETGESKILRLPRNEEIEPRVADEQLIVEFYSR